MKIVVLYYFLKVLHAFVKLVPILFFLERTTLALILLLESIARIVIDRLNLHRRNPAECYEFQLVACNLS
jgi:hypothetical protein